MAWATDQVVKDMGRVESDSFRKLQAREPGKHYRDAASDIAYRVPQGGKCTEILSPLRKMSGTRGWMDTHSHPTILDECLASALRERSSPQEEMGLRLRLRKRQGRAHRVLHRMHVVFDKPGACSGQLRGTSHHL